MSSSQGRNNLYPQVNKTNPDSNSPFSSNPPPKTSSSLYPSLQMNELAENLFADDDPQTVAVERNPSFDSSEEVIVTIPGAILHLIDQQQSVELAAGEFSIVQLKQNGNIVAALARVGHAIQWPLAKDEAAVKLDEAHYFFTLRVPSESGEELKNGDGILNYGLTFVGKGQGGKLRELDGVLERFSAFRVEEAKGVGSLGKQEVGKEEEKAAAYWTTIAPNVEDYSGSVARMIAMGSGQVIRGILWCGDVTVDRLRWGNEFLKRRMEKKGKFEKSEVSPEALKRMQRAKQMTKMSEQVATGILSGVVKVSGFFTSSVANSKVGQKFFSLLPGEIVLASLDGFNRVWDAVEVAGRNVMSTTSTVTTGLVSQRYGEDAAKATHDGFGAAGHAIGTAWAVFKIRKALNPKSVIKPTTLAKAAAEAGSAKLKAKK